MKRIFASVNPPLEDWNETCVYFVQFVNLHVNCKFLWKGYTYVPVYQFYLILVVNVNVNVNFKFLIRNVFRFRNADFLYISCFSFVKDDALIPDAQV